MRAIRIVFGTVAAVWLIGVVLIGVGATWLHNDEDAQKMVAAGAIGSALNNDPGASAFERARNLSKDVEAGEQIMASMEATRAEAAERRAALRQERADKAGAADGWGRGSAAATGQGDWGPAQ
jgi:hypothetical protein